MLEEWHINLDRFIAEAGRAETFEKRSKIASRHQPIRSVFLVRQGCLAMTSNLPCGRIFCPQIYVPGDFTPTLALMPGEVKMDLMALSETTLTALPRDRFLDYLDLQPGRDAWITSQLKRNLLHSGMRGIVTNFGDAPAKLAALIAEIWIRTGREDDTPKAGAQIPLTLTQTHLSLVSGLSRAQVSRTLADLCKAGYFRKEGDILFVEDAEYLKTAIRDLKAMMPCVD